MRKASILLIFIAAIVLYACKHTAPDQPVMPGGGGTGGGGTGGGGTGGGTTAICFESDILPIFRSSCAIPNCHDAAAHNDGYVFDTYANITRKDVRPGNASGSKVYKVLFEDGDKRMPRPPNAPLTDQQKNLIGRWINEGAQNTTNCASTCNPAEFKYAANIKPIFEANCTGCHSGGAPAGGFNISTYAGAYANRQMIVVRIQHPNPDMRMPKGQPPLPDCKIQQIKNWVAAGAPNN